MRSLFTSLKKLVLCTVFFATIGTAANATIYTAVLSGSFGSSLTWGGLIPGSLLSSDIVIIPSGITVNLPSDLTITGTSTLTVNGTLTSATGTALIITAGSLTGSGTIDVDSLALGLTSGLTFSGDITADAFTSLGASVSSTADVTVRDALHLTSGSLSFTAGSLTVGEGSVITRAGGSLSASGSGMLHLDSTYSVWYSATGSTTTGVELTGSGLSGLTISTTGTVMLSADATLDGMLTLSSGTLALSGHRLTLSSGADVAATGTGTITGSTTSDLTISTGASLSGMLRFASGSGGTLRDLTVGTGSSGSASLGTDLTLSGVLTLSSGTFGLGGHTLTLGSGADLSASGTGTITGSSSSNLVINTGSSLTGALRFATGSGSSLHDLTLGLGGTGTAMLGTDLTLNGTLTLTTGTLSISGHTLTLGTGADFSATGSGTLTGSSSSDLIINGGSSLTGALRFSAGGNILDDLSIGTGSTGSVMLGTDLTLNGMLTLTSGTLHINGHTLTLDAGADISASGTGTLTGSSSSDLMLTTGGSLTGGLRFATGSGAILDDVTIDLGGSGSAMLGSDLTLNGTLTLTTGTLSLGGHALTLGTGADLSASGTGTITGSSSSDLTISTGSSLSGMLRFSAGGGLLDDFTIGTGATGSATLSSDLMLSGMLTLTSGTLDLSGHTLTLGAGADLAASGAGTLTGSSSSDLIINTSGSLTGALRFATGSGATLGNLTLNLGSTGSSLSLGSEVTINGTMNLINGNIKLGSSNLNIATAGSLMGGTSGSYVITDGTGSLVMNLTAGLTDTFEVGTMTHYAPMVVIGGTGSATGDVSVNVKNGVLSAGTTGTLISTTESVVDATWDVTSTASTGINYSLMAMWSADMELNGFDRAHAYLSHYTSGSWDATGGSASSTSGSMYSITRAGITSLSPFMVTDDVTPTTVPNFIAGEANVYPNPATNTIYISGTGVDNICVYDVCGKEVKNVNGHVTEVSISELPAGTYIVRLTGDNLNATRKIVKE